MRTLKKGGGEVVWGGGGIALVALVEVAVIMLDVMV